MIAKITINTKKSSLVAQAAILATQEAETGGSQGQSLSAQLGNLEARLVNLLRVCLKRPTRTRAGDNPGVEFSPGGQESHPIPKKQMNQSISKQTHQPLHCVLTSVLLSRLFVFLLDVLRWKGHLRDTNDALYHFQRFTRRNQRQSFMNHFSIAKKQDIIIKKPMVQRGIKLYYNRNWQYLSIHLFTFLSNIFIEHLGQRFLNLWVITPSEVD